MKIKLVNSYHNTEIIVDAITYTNKYDRDVAEISPEDLARAATELCGGKSCTCHKYESCGYDDTGKSYMIGTK